MRKGELQWEVSIVYPQVTKGEAEPGICISHKSGLLSSPGCRHWDVHVHSRLSSIVWQKGQTETFCHILSWPFWKVNPLSSDPVHLSFLRVQRPCHFGKYWSCSSKFPKTTSMISSEPSQGLQLGPKSWLEAIHLKVLYIYTHIYIYK
jgi:hypothetical protein